MESRTYSQVRRLLIQCMGEVDNFRKAIKKKNCTLGWAVENSECCDRVPLSAGDTEPGILSLV